MEQTEAEKRNVALLASLADVTFVHQSIKAFARNSKLIRLSANDHLADLTFAAHLPIKLLKLDDSVLDQTILRDALPEHAPLLIVDICSHPRALEDTPVFEVWADIAEALMRGTGCTVITFYNRAFLIESHMQTVLRAHPRFLAPSGIYQNPFWLPIHLRFKSIDEHLAHYLGRAVPDYAGQDFFDTEGRSFARNNEAGWLSPQSKISLSQRPAARWQIRCLGPLEVLVDGNLVDWKLPGGSPNKMRTLFAHLLMAGEKGTHVDQISELLWPMGEDPTAKRARLHHAASMLRKTLGSKAAIVRNGEYYKLSPPVGSWTDVSTFEQSCRRGLSLAKDGHLKEALLTYQAAENLYKGNLFEDLPIEYTNSELDDWCGPRRSWLREMFIKLMRDSSVCLRALDQPDDALDKCQKALQSDPTSEDANAEAMRVYHALGRYDAIARQYAQYIYIVGGESVSGTFSRLYRSLMN